MHRPEHGSFIASSPARVFGVMFLGLALVPGAAAHAQDRARAGLEEGYRRAAAEDPVAALERYLPEFQAAAGERAGTAAAAPFLVWILEHGGLQVEAAGAALRALLEGPADEASRIAAARRLPYLYAVLGPETVGRALDRLAAGASAAVRAEAALARAVLLATEWGPDSGNRQRRALATARELADAAGDAALRERTDRLVPQVRGLRIGETAPEILGLDMDGEPFRLSDYRGKVVVLDFWGDW